MQAQSKDNKKKWTGQPVHFLNKHMENLWYKNAVFYEISVRAFKDSNGDGHGDLRGLTEKLDYLQTLGVDCIWIMPIYPSPLQG